MDRPTVKLLLSVTLPLTLGQVTPSFAQDQGSRSASSEGAPEEKPDEKAPEEKPDPPIEDDDGWFSWPFASSKTEWGEDFPGTRWAGLGIFVGWVHRPSASAEIDYRPGVAYGLYLRPEITSWLSARLFYRHENLPVEVAYGAFDYEGESHSLAFEQPNLEVVNVGVRLEPQWVMHPRFRVRGILGWSWLGFRAPMPVAPGFNDNDEERGDKGYGGVRSAVEVNFIFGAGFSLDLIQDWLDLSLDATYSLNSSQSGSAYEALQVVIDGEITHLAPLPKMENSTDIIVSLGAIF